VLEDQSRTDAGMLDRVTIGDVAERAGVSIATVSRVVNGRYGVAPATLDRVNTVIADLGYESSLIARSLRSQRTNVIGVLVTDIEPFSAEVLKGAATALRGGEYELVVYSGGHGGDHVGWERRYISRLGGTLTDGTILVTPTVTEVQTNQPVVAVDPHSGASAFPTFASQNFEGALDATRHLIGLGHRRIGFLGGRSDLESARLREQGYRAGLEEAGISFDGELVLEGGFTEATAEAPARQLLSLAERPTAIFASNDLSAIQTMRTAAEFGLNIPHAEGRKVRGLRHGRHCSHDCRRTDARRRSHTAAARAAFDDTHCCFSRSAHHRFPRAPRLSFAEAKIDWVGKTTHRTGDCQTRSA